MNLKSLSFLAPRTLRRRSQVACALMAAASCVGGLSMVLPGSTIGGSAMALLRDPSSILADRSPGARAAGALTQSKLRRAAVPARSRIANLPNAVGGPTKRAQAALAPAVSAPIFPSTEAVAPEALNLPVETLGPGEELIASNSGTVGGGSGPGFGVPGGGSLGGGGGGFEEGPRPPVLPGNEAGAVPEPATWFTMLVGLFVIGYGVRKRSPRAGVSVTHAAGD